MSRVQLALNVDDLDASIAFYAALFAAEPAKVRPGYANFAITEPPLKLVLIQNPGHGGSLNHLGIEVAGTGAVDAEQTRLAVRCLADAQLQHAAPRPDQTADFESQTVQALYLH